MSAISDFYIEQAEKCAAEAASTNLVSVGERSTRAASAWQTLADKVLRAEAAKLAKESASPAGPPI